MNESIRHSPQQQHRKFGPMPADAPGIGELCPACKIALIAIGPGDSPEEQERARVGRPYNAVAVQAHWICVTGEE